MEGPRAWGPTAAATPIECPAPHGIIARCGSSAPAVQLLHPRCCWRHRATRLHYNVTCCSPSALPRDQLQRGVDDALEPLRRFRIARVVRGVERGDHNRGGLGIDVEQRSEPRLSTSVPDEPHAVPPEHEY